MPEPLAVLACPLCDTPGTVVLVSRFRGGGIRHRYRELRCPSGCGSYQMHDAVYERLPFAPTVAAALAAMAQEVSLRGTGEQLDIDDILLRSLVP